MAVKENLGIRIPVMSKVLIHKIVVIHVTLINQTTDSHRTLQELQRGKKEGGKSEKPNSSQTDSHFSGLWIIPKVAEEKKDAARTGEINEGAD